MKELILNENKLYPYTDAQLCKLLGKDVEYHIARRTVAKYREQMGIETSKLRRAALMRASKFISILPPDFFMPIVVVYLSLNLVPSIIVINNYLGFVYFILFLSTILLPLTSVFY